jgi:N-dimethylarginine dimethylaminohydrolase
MTDVKQLAEKLRTLAHGLDMGFLHEDDAMAVLRAAIGVSEAGAETSLRNVQRSGWKLVPVEPTDAMIAGGIDALREHTQVLAIDRDPLFVWRYMLAAAPKVSP